MSPADRSTINPARRPGRRAVLASGAALMAAGCANSGSEGSASASGSGGAAAPPAAGTALVPASEVPVGSAAIVAAAGTIVTQPQSGTFKGFSNVCPHEGCAITVVQDAELVCPCHGSRFDLQGQPISGPAQTGLAETAVSVAGGEVVAGE